MVINHMFYMVSRRRADEPLEGMRLLAKLWDSHMAGIGFTYEETARAPAGQLTA